MVGFLLLYVFGRNWTHMPVLVAIAAIQLMLPHSTVSKALAGDKEVVLFKETPSVPQALARMGDGSYLVTLDTYPPVLVKLSRTGNIQWVFKHEGQGHSDVRFSMAAADKSGGVIVCATRKDGEKNRLDMPGFLVKLSANGEQIGQLDASVAELNGGPFFSVFACAPWGDGFVVVANERRPTAEPDDFGHMSSWPYRNVVIRLRSDLSVVWRRPLALHLVSHLLDSTPKQTAAGDLLVLGMERMALVGIDGSVKATTDTPPCVWLRTESASSRIRLACAGLSPPTSSTIFEYDEALKVVSKIPLGNEDFGLPSVSELGNGNFALLGNDASKGAFLRIYDPKGRLGPSYNFPRGDTEIGLGIDCIPEGKSGVVVARASDRKGTGFVTVISWLTAE